MELIVRTTSRDGTPRQDRVTLERQDDGGYTVTLVDGEGATRRHVLDLALAGDLLSLREVDSGRQHEVAVRRTGRRDRATYSVSSRRGDHAIEVLDPLAALAEEARGEGGGARRVEAMMPGRVVEILVAEGDTVEPGQGVVVVEAMKMKNEIQAESPGVVARIFVEAGHNVEGGDPLFEIE